MQLSHAEAYTFETPPGVVTGDDAVKLFTSSEAKDGLIIFANLNPESEVRSLGGPPGRGRGGRGPFSIACARCACAGAGDPH